MRGLSQLVLLGVLSVGCSRSPAGPSAAGPAASTPENGAPRVTAEELTAPEGHIELGALVLERDGKPALVLAPDGALQDVSEKRALGTLGRDGRFVDPAGKLVAQLTPEGEVELPNGDVLPVTLGSDGTVNMLKEGRKIRLKDDGSLEGANPEGPVIKLSGFKRETRRTAMFLLVLAAFPVQSRP